MTSAKGATAVQEKSRSWVSPSLVAALEAGRSFEQWLDGRTPVASYGRISADIKKDEHGVEDQHAANERSAARHALAIVKYYQDNDKTAASEDVEREMFDLLVKEIGKRRVHEGYAVTGVLCTETERLYRLPGDYGRIVKALTIDDDGRLVVDGEEIKLYDDSADYIGLIGVARSMSEIRKLRKRTKRSHRARAARGLFTGGPRRFGWLGRDPREGRPANKFRHPEEWPILLRMIRDAEAGKGWTTIAKKLNAAGILTAKGGKWSSTGVRILLTNPFICGYRILDGALVRDDDGNVKVGDWDAPATPQQWEAICERSRLAAAQRGAAVADADPSPGSPSDRSRRYVFSGFLLCGGHLEDGSLCLNRMSGCRRKKKDGTYTHTYRCATYNGYGCGRIGRHGPDVDRFLTELVLQKHEEMLRDRAVVESARPWPSAARLAELETKRSNLKTRFRDGRVGEDDYYDDLAFYDREIKRLHGERAKHSHAARRTLAAPTSGIREAWEDMDVAQKRAAVADVLHAVIVHPMTGMKRNGPFDPSKLEPKWKNRAA